jgi:hypothetical protein
MTGYTTPHHPTGSAMTLSPAAQAVTDAMDEWASYDIPTHLIAAAALRAAADQVVPKTPPPKFAAHYEEGIWDGKDDARDELLAIAAELDPQS